MLRMSLIKQFELPIQLQLFWFGSVRLLFSFKNLNLTYVYAIDRASYTLTEAIVPEGT
jgi:hypothetical protein